MREECRNVRGASSSPAAATPKPIEFASPLKMNSNSASLAPRLRLKRSMSVSLLYDPEDDATNSAQASAFDDAFANVDATRSSHGGGIDTLESELRESLLGSLDELLDELEVYFI